MLNAAKRWTAWPVLVLVGIPAAAFFAPYVAGHVTAFGDNLRQNLPLRALVGRDISSGTAPLWDPYLWSGSPLLAGFNAGAAYPTTALFAVLPVSLAWALTETILFASLAWGTYLLFRTSRMSKVPAVMAAAVFSFAGASAAQAVHVDMSSGMASLPWMLLAVRHVVRHDGRERNLFWMAVLGVAYALVVLGGAPEAMLDEAVLVVAYGALQSGRDRRAWLRLLAYGAGGAALALGLSAIQWWPGLGFVAHSQRAVAKAVFTGSGSFPPAEGFLAVAPYLLGGYGLLGLPYFFGTYNLPEASTYIGILPLIGFVTLLAPTWSRRLPLGEWRTWTVMAAVGIVLALGSHTPLERLLVHIPLYGSQRLQSRNIMGADLGASALFGWWLDRGALPRSAGAARTWARLAALLPLGVAAGLSVWALSGTTAMLKALGASPSASATLTTQAMAGAAVLICLGAVQVAWARERMAATRWTRLAVAFVVADIGIYSAFGDASFGPTAAQATGHSGVTNAIAARLSPDGRYAVYDPQLYDYSALLVDGSPDLGIERGIQSVQGYGSILDATYENATSTHNQAGLSPSALASGRFAPLNLHVLATLPESFMQPLAAAPAPNGSYRVVTLHYQQNQLMPGGTHFGPQVPAPTLAPPLAPLGPGHQEGWFFGGTVALTSVQLSVAPSGTLGGSRLEVGLLAPDGTLEWLPRINSPAGAPSVGTPTGTSRAGLRVVHIAVPHSLGARQDGAGKHGFVGMVVKDVGTTSVPIRAAFVSAPQGSFVLDAALARAVTPSRWKWSTAVHGWGIFVSRTRPRQAWTVPLTAGGTPAPAHAAHVPVKASVHASVRVVSSSSDGTETIAVTSPVPVELDRSVAYVPEWHALVRTPGRPAVGTRVVRTGLVQGVRLGPGRHTVTFQYRPAKVGQGVAATLISVGTLMLLAMLSVLGSGRRRRRGRSPVRRPASRSIAGGGLDTDTCPTAP